MARETTGFDDWVKVQRDLGWVVINLGGNGEPIADTTSDASGTRHEGAHRDESDSEQDVNEETRGSFKCRDVDYAAYGLRATAKFFHGAFEVDAANDHAQSGRVSEYGRAHDTFCGAESCEYADDKGACKEGGIDDDDDENQEEEEEDNDEYSDMQHEGALEDEEGKQVHFLMDAMERHLSNPVKQGWQEYVCSVQTEARRELHEWKMVSFRGYGPQPRPFITGSTCFNPLFEQMWLPWAINAEYCHDEDMGLLVSDGATGFMQCSLAANRYLSSAVPILPVLEYMVNRTPGKKIAHIGSCTSTYWAALLQQLGASNVIVTEGAHTIPVGLSEIEQIDEEMFFELDMAVRHALFFLRPSKRSANAEPCMAERFLFCFPGDTIFFVGERGKHADNFDIAQWAEEHAIEGWYVEKEMEIPCWPGSHDTFLCITKATKPVDMLQ